MGPLIVNESLANQRWQASFAQIARCSFNAHRLHDGQMPIAFIGVPFYTSLLVESAKRTGLHLRLPFYCRLIEHLDDAGPLNEDAPHPGGAAHAQIPRVNQLLQGAEAHTKHLSGFLPGIYGIRVDASLTAVKHPNISYRPSV
jgi:hypothetical protein